MKILMVLTSHDKLGNTGRKTGFWLEELAAPYYVFKDAGAEIVLASPKGGQPPLDPKSNEPNFQTDLTHRFEADAANTWLFLSGCLPVAQPECQSPSTLRIFAHRAKAVRCMSCWSITGAPSAWAWKSFCPRSSAFVVAPV